MSRTAIVEAVCPTQTLCYVADSGGRLHWVTNRGRDRLRWRSVAAAPAYGFGSLACPRVSLCIATDGSGFGDVLESTDPTAGKRAWRAIHLSDIGVEGVVCGSIHLCMTWNDDFVSHAPVGPASAWKPTNRPGGPITCHGPMLCASIALDLNGESGTPYVSANPAAAGSWLKASAGEAISSISCPTSTKCVAVGVNGDAFVGSWRR